jgi:ankyrin repeat protein
MDKRIGWNLDSMEHAMFNWARPIPLCPEAVSQFSPVSVSLPKRRYAVSDRASQVLASKRRIVLETSVVFLVLLWATTVGPEPLSRASISPRELIRAVSMGRQSLIDLCLIEQVDPNGHDAQGRTALLIATSRQDWKTARRLIEAGAVINLADNKGFTPLMAAAMQGNLKLFRLLLAHSTNLHPEAVCADGRDLLGLALDSGNPEIIHAVTERLPLMPHWTTSTRRALNAALLAGDNDQIRLLLGKHAAPPTPEGKNVPLLAYAIARNDQSLFSTLLDGGADPNTVLPARCDKDFLALLSSKSLRGYIEEDKNVTVLMLAAGLGHENFVQALLDVGADRKRATGRYKMLALYIAAQTGQWRCAQILLGKGPSPDRLRIEISLASQRVALVKNGVPIFRAPCSTGRPGYCTRTGNFVITDKNRNHRSTIYHVDMPYFMRLSCLDFGMHAGVVPNYPASHGCIRLPSDAARKFFAEIPIGTLVTVR